MKRCFYSVRAKEIKTTTKTTLYLLDWQKLRKSTRPIVGSAVGQSVHFSSVSVCLCQFVSVTRVYVPRFFVSSQQRFGATDIKALGVSQLSGLGQIVLQLLGI